MKALVAHQQLGTISVKKVAQELERSPMSLDSHPERPGSVGLVNVEAGYIPRIRGVDMLYAGEVPWAKYGPSCGARALPASPSSSPGTNRSERGEP